MYVCVYIYIYIYLFVYTYIDVYPNEFKASSAISRDEGVTLRTGLAPLLRPQHRALHPAPPLRQ